MPRDDRSPEQYAFNTLPDYLARGMRLVLVGLNPGLYSVQRGCYFARPTNRFWPAFSRSRLSADVRAAMGKDHLRPEDDAALTAYGIGFTDVVKVPTRSAGELTEALFRLWAPAQALRAARRLLPRQDGLRRLPAPRPRARSGAVRAGPAARPPR